MNSKKLVGYIDVTPTWQSLVRPLLEVYTTTTKEEVRRSIQEEFLKMARAADAYIRRFPNTQAAETPKEKAK